MGSCVESKCDVYVLEGGCSIDESRDLGKPKSKTKCMLNKRAYGLAFSPLLSPLPSLSLSLYVVAKTTTYAA